MVPQQAIRAPIVVYAMVWLTTVVVEHIVELTEIPLQQRQVGLGQFHRTSMVVLYSFMTDSMALVLVTPAKGMQL